MSVQPLVAGGLTATVGVSQDSLIDLATSNFSEGDDLPLAEVLPLPPPLPPPCNTLTWMSRLDEETRAMVRRNVDNGGIFERERPLVVPGRSGVRVGEWDGVVLPLTPYLLAVRAAGAAVQAARSAVAGEDEGSEESGDEEPLSPSTRPRSAGKPLKDPTVGDVSSHHGSSLLVQT